MKKKFIRLIKTIYLHISLLRTNNPPKELVFLYYPGKDPLHFRHVTDVFVDSANMLARFGTAGRFVYNDTKEVRIATVLIISVITFVLFLCLIPLIADVTGRIIVAVFGGVIFGVLPGIYLGRKLATKPSIRLLAQIQDKTYPIIHPTYIDKGYTEIELKDPSGSTIKKTVPQSWKASTLHEINAARDSELYYKTQQTSQRKLELGLMVTMCIASLVLLFLFGTANFGTESEIVQGVQTLTDDQIIENQIKALTESEAQ